MVEREACSLFIGGRNRGAMGAMAPLKFKASP